MIPAYPLQWPIGWPRTKNRADSRFTKRDEYGRGPQRSLAVSDGVERVLKELERFAINRQDIVISTNVRTRLDGLPRSGEKEPEDPGCAVYWEESTSERRVMAIDQYVTVADNLAAIAATLDAMRAIERHGGAQILDRAFTGFIALPAPTDKKTWREVMGFEPSEVVNAHAIRARYRKLAFERHPDKGGSHDAMVELNGALAEAEKAIGEKV